MSSKPSSSSKAKLSVNLNKVALLRNQRPLTIPSVTAAAEQVIAAGAHGITVHPRPDQRHIRPGDVYDLAELLKQHPGIEYNIEGNPFNSDLMELVRATRPTQCTLVPDDPAQATSDHGWDVAKDGERLRPILEELHALGVRSAMFMDADCEQIQRLTELSLDRIELYTEPYAEAFLNGEAQSSVKTYQAAAELAQQLGLGVNAGHDLSLENLPDFAVVPNVLEVSIGHAITADALTYGFTLAVQKYLDVLGWHAN